MTELVAGSDVMEMVRRGRSSTGSLLAAPCTVVASADCGRNGCLVLDVDRSPGGIEATRLAWEQEFRGISPPEFACNNQSEFPFLVEGECAGDEVRFLCRGGGFSVEAHFFDADSGNFLAFVEGGDFIDPFCFGKSFGPRRIRCTNPVVTDVICGNLFTVGDEIDLP